MTNFMQLDNVQCTRLFHMERRGEEAKEAEKCHLWPKECAFSRPSVARVGRRPTDTLKHCPLRSSLALSQGNLLFLARSLVRQAVIGGQVGALPKRFSKSVYIDMEETANSHVLLGFSYFSFLAFCLVSRECAIERPRQPATRRRRDAAARGG